MKRLTLILLICLSPASTTAITREAAISYALENSESIRIYRESAQILRDRGELSAAFIRPQMTLEAGYTEMDDSRPDMPALFSWFDTPSRDIAVGFTASQLVFAGGRIQNSIKLTKTLYDQAARKDQTGERDIARRVKQMFDTVLLKKALLIILEDRLTQRREELSDADDLWKAGMVTSLDVRQAQLNVNFARSEWNAGQNELSESLVAFNLSLGRSVEDPTWDAEGNFEPLPDTALLIERLGEALREDRLMDIRSAETEKDIAAINFNLAKGERWPTLSITASGTSAGESSKDMNESWNLGLQASFHLFDGGRIQAHKAIARSEMKIAEESLARTRKELAGQIDILADTLRSIENRIWIQRDSVTLAKSNYDDARSQYRAGALTQVQLGVFNLSYSEARFQLQQLFFLLHEQMTQGESLLEIRPSIHP